MVPMVVHIDADTSRSDRESRKEKEKRKKRKILCPLGTKECDRLGLSVQNIYICHSHSWCKKKKLKISHHTT